MAEEHTYDSPGIAIIGMSGRFPGAKNVNRFWQNLIAGVKSVIPVSEDELKASGIPEAIWQHPNYVRARPYIDDIDLLDAAFLGLLPREAELMDPQHRLFLECAYEALEDAAYDPEKYEGLIGVFGGSGFPYYLTDHLFPDVDSYSATDQFQIGVSNDRDTLTSTVSYKLDLKGPAVTVQTSCSTAMVAVHLACQSLLNYECDMALAGGVALAIPSKSGYMYSEGGIMSPDGNCRAFDADAKGTVFGDGVSLVVLKRMEDALEENAHIYAVITGSALNNDGRDKVGFTAPGTGGQAQVIVQAMAVAGVGPEDMDYVETHGTGTPLGDAAELSAMIRAFGPDTGAGHFCAIGSLKPNVGHLDRAAGSAGLIKTALALHHRKIPPTINFERTAPDADLTKTPFFVNTELRDWPDRGRPGRAGVSSFGIGGTNVHAILEEAPRPEISDPEPDCHLLILSAKSEPALEQLTCNLVTHLREHPELRMDDVAFTLQVGRTAFNHRSALVCTGREDAILALENQEPDRVMSRVQVHRERPVAFMFPDAGEQPPGAVAELYETEPNFRNRTDDCLGMLPAQLEAEVRHFLLEETGAHGNPAHSARIGTFITEYALARTLLRWGITPRIMLGCGIGEHVAACVSGSVSAEEMLTWLSEAKEGRPPITSDNPDIPCISGTGDRLQAGIAKLLETPDLLLEIGTGQHLCEFIRKHPNCDPARHGMIFPTLPEPGFPSLLNALGRLWLAGADVDWQGFCQNRPCRRLSLPTYPFQRQRYWIDAPGKRVIAPENKSAAKKNDIADWFYVPVWEPARLPVTDRSPAKNWLIFEDAHGVSHKLAEALLAQGSRVTRVRPGPAYARETEKLFSVNPATPGDYALLFEELAKSGQPPAEIIHAWSISTPNPADDHVARFRSAQQTGFYSLIFLVQALGTRAISEKIRLTVISDKMQPAGEAGTVPEKGTVPGLLRVIPQEYQNIRCRSVDLDRKTEQTGLTEQLLAEVGAPVTETAIAYRGGERFVQRFRSEKLDRDPDAVPLKTRGVYLITGGLGAVGLILARYLARNFQARLILTGRSGLPARDTWTDRPSGDEPTAHKIRKVQALEKLGAEVLPIAADVISERQMGKAVEEAYNRFGTLNGVIHAAGLNDDTAFQSVQQSEPHICERHFLPKVYGLYVLDRVLRNRPLDFFLCFSSLSAILGGLGLSSYAAANSFMDAYIHQHNRTSPAPWMTVNWDTWQTGKHSGETALGAAIAEFEMTPEEGSLAFALTLASDQTHLVNSTGDLHRRIREWVDLKALAEFGHQPGPGTLSRPELTTEYVPAANDYEQRIAAVWQKVLGLDPIGIHDNFFDLGGNSLVSLRIINSLQKKFDTQIPIVALFEAPTVSTLAEYLRPKDTRAVTEPAEDLLAERRQAIKTPGRERADTRKIAIVGMTGRFPGAGSVEQFWQNLCDGIESVSHFSDEELVASGISPHLINDPNYVKARPIIEGTDLFDGFFFGYSPHETELMDPQHRLFMECCWEALELAGYNSEKYGGVIGVFGGGNLSTYLLRLLQDPLILGRVGVDQLAIGNEKDSLATAVSYKLNLTGPSLSVQTFCSTSLVATHLACGSLLSGECDMALAGGVSIRVPQKSGHLRVEGGMESPDGHCRTFDADARGTLFGDGVAVVVLKRLAEAVEDGDTIHAVLRASAVNNDGSLKVGYTAPSVAAQARVVADALADSGTDPETVGYVEAHGTATALGDPIEVTALTRAFRRHTAKTRYCAIGSVKTNVGHLDRAAGATGLIKAALTVRTGMIPPSLHFRTPNPKIDFENSPFYVNTELSPWPLADGKPRRAGVNSLGMGGTNAHVIVEEPPRSAPSSPSRAAQLLLLSARSETALDKATDNLARHLEENPEQNFADIAHTLQVGRASFVHRRMAVCHNTEDAIRVLNTKPPERVLSHYQPPVNRSVVFMFPGMGGRRHLYMAEGLYLSEPVFERSIEECCQILYPYLGAKLCDLLYPSREKRQDRTEDADPSPAAQRLNRRLNRTGIVQPVTFAVEYALARLLMSWGIRPRAMVGHSLGEYVAACLSGVLSLSDALKLVAGRARLIQESEQGRMMAVSLSAEDIRPFLGENISLAVHNGRTSCVVAGPDEAVAELGTQLDQQGVVNRELSTTRAFHSKMMEPLADSLTRLVRTVTLNPPAIPYMSNVTGDWITPGEACDPDYWARHLCGTVQFLRSLDLLLGDDQQVLLEVGPGKALGAFVKQHPACRKEQFPLVLPTMPSASHHPSDLAFLLEQLGRLWLVGVEPDWDEFYQHETRRRVPVPTYPFERERYWIEPDISQPSVNSEPPSPSESKATAKKDDITDWFYVPVWEPAGLSVKKPSLARNWLIFEDTHGVGHELAEALREKGSRVTQVRPGPAYARQSDRLFSVNPANPGDYALLLEELAGTGGTPTEILHVWSIDTPEQTDDPVARFQSVQRTGFHSLICLAQAIGSQGISEDIRLTVISDNMQPVPGDTEIVPEKATVSGLIRTIPQEYQNIRCRAIDLSLSTDPARTRLTERLLAEVGVPVKEAAIAYRGGERLVQRFTPRKLDEDPDVAPLKSGGSYLITGGLGAVGLILARHLAHNFQARLALTSRSGLPPRDTWADRLAGDDPVAHRIRKVRELEQLGAEVLPIAADVASGRQMAQAVNDICERFGGLDGVIHGAGLATGQAAFQAVQQSEAHICESHFLPKVHGLHVLDRVLGDRPLDFFICLSSLSAILGGLGMGSYAAANSFMDAYVHQRNRASSTSWMAVNWGPWGTGESLPATSSLTEFEMTPEEGTRAFALALNSGQTHLVHSTGDLQMQIRQWIDLEARAPSDRQTGLPKHARPDQPTPYVPPGNEMEEKIADIWQNLLRIEGLGIHDNFFELGGNSLIGLQMISRLRENFQVSLPLSLLFDAPSVAEFAIATEMAIIERLENMSEEDISGLMLDA